MGKTTYTAIDPNGATHTRTTDRRTYTHTVVYLHDYEADLAAYNARDWKLHDASNYAYDVKVASGNDPHPARSWASAERGYSAEEIAASQARVVAENARRVVNAKEATDGLTVEEYHAILHAKRIASVEADKAKGYYDAFANAGWCGRLDLAEKLAAKTKGLRVTILKAETSA